MEGALLLLLCFLSFVIGFLSVAVYVSWQQAQQLLEAWDKRAPHWPHVGSSKILNSWKTNPPCAVKASVKLADVEEIDEELNKVIELGMRYYFEKWYHSHITPDPVCVQQARDILVHVITHVSNKSKQVDYLTYLVETIMEDFLEHFKRYKHACSKCQSGGGGEGSGTKISNTSRLRLIDEAFFEADDPENPWKTVCLYPEAKNVENNNEVSAFQEYVESSVILRSATNCPHTTPPSIVTEVLLFLILPEVDFSNPLMHVLLTDVVMCQVLAPLLQTLIMPDNFNKTVIFMCKDSFLTPETFTAAMNEGSTELEMRSFQIWINEEILKLQKTGLTDADSDKFDTYGNLKTAANTIMLGEVRDKPNHNSSLLSFKVSIPTFSISHEGSNKHCLFVLDVRCRHSQASVEEHWTTQRRYRDFQDIHLTLRNQVENFPSSLTLPSLPTFNKLDPQRLEIRRQSLEQYIGVVSGDQFLKNNPQTMSQVILFLTEGEFTRNTSDLHRKMDSIFKPLSSMKRSALKKKASFATSMPNLAGAMTGSSVSSSSSSPKPSPSSSRKVGDKTATGEEDEDSLPVDMMIDLLEEVFDMSDKKGLAQQLPYLLKMLAGGKISRKVVQTADWLTSSQQVAQYIHFIHSMLWPGGFPATMGEFPASDVKARRALLARSKMVGSLPDELRRMIGNDSTVKGMARNVRDTFKLLRTEISKAYSH